MSGIEVAGIVLAVFPIVVKGLQQIPESAEVIKSWRKYGRELGRYSRTLVTQRIVFLNTLERLSEDIVESDGDLETLLQNPYGALSHGPYEEALVTRLGRSYDSFLLIMANMLEALRTLQMELGVDEKGKVR